MWRVNLEVTFRNNFCLTFTLARKTSQPHCLFVYFFFHLTAHLLPLYLSTSSSPFHHPNITPSHRVCDSITSSTHSFPSSMGAANSSAMAYAPGDPQGAMDIDETDINDQLRKVGLSPTSRSANQITC
jgi:hypothetical protein